MSQGRINNETEASAVPGSIKLPQEAYFEFILFPSLKVNTNFTRPTETNSWGTVLELGYINYFESFFNCDYCAPSPKYTFTVTCLRIVYRMSQEEWTKLRESVPYVKLYRYNPKHLYSKLNGYGDNGHRKVWAFGMSTYCKPSVTPYSSTAHARQRETTS